MHIALFIGWLIFCAKCAPVRYITEILFLLSPFGWIVLVPMFGYSYIKAIDDYLCSLSVVYDTGDFKTRTVIYNVQKTVIIIISIAIILACIAAMCLIIAAGFEIIWG